MKFQDRRKLAWSIEFDRVDQETQQRLHLCERARRFACERADSSRQGPTLPSPCPGIEHRDCVEAAPYVQDLSRHAVTRLRQRGITMEQVRTVVDYGQSQRSHGASRYFLDRSARARLAVEMPEALRSLGTVDILVVVADDGCLVTAAHRTRRLLRDVAAPWRAERKH